MRYINAIRDNFEVRAAQGFKVLIRTNNKDVRINLRKLLDEIIKPYGKSIIPL